MNSSNTNNNDVIGNTIKFDNLEVAEKDLPNTMNWLEAKKECEKLGSGWRLPTKDELNIISSNESIEDLKIIDNAGRIIFESKPSSLNVKLEVGNFADGLYTIQISSASKMIISKFIVRK